jgi:uncharacterized protein YggU (UPF0235/DUF167 family)
MELLGDLTFAEDATGVRFAVFAKPRAKRTQVRGVREGALEISLGAAPVDGAANRALLEALAGLLGVARSDVTLLRGESSKNKFVHVRGLGADDVRQRLRDNLP